MKIIIELIENSTEPFTNGWNVNIGDKYAFGLCYDEMLGLVAAITMPEKRPCMQWLKTRAEHDHILIRNPLLLKNSNNQNDTNL